MNGGLSLKCIRQLVHTVTFLKGVLGGAGKLGVTFEVTYWSRLEEMNKKGR